MLCSVVLLTVFSSASRRGCRHNAVCRIAAKSSARSSNMSAVDSTADSESPSLLHCSCWQSGTVLMRHTKSLPAMATCSVYTWRNVYTQHSSTQHSALYRSVRTIGAYCRALLATPDCPHCCLSPHSRDSVESGCSLLRAAASCAALPAAAAGTAAVCSSSVATRSAAAFMRPINRPG